MKLEINGEIVEVDDSFADLDATAQQKTVDEIAASLKTPTKERAELTSAPSAATNAKTYLGQAATNAAIGGAEMAKGPIMPTNATPFEPAKFGGTGAPVSQPGLFPEGGVRTGPAAAIAADLNPMNAKGAAGILVNNMTIDKALEHIGGTGKEAGRGLVGSGTDLLRAVLGPVGDTTLKQFATQTIPNAAKAVGAGLIAPENLMTLPYNMAAYEQNKIRANPNAPGLQNNPYAQAYRGEFPTQGAAAAANRRQAIAGQQYGGLSADEQQMLKQDRELSYAMRLKAAKKVLGQP